LVGNKKTFFRKSKNKVVQCRSLNAVYFDPKIVLLKSKKF
jgi:hypothetical protein